MPAQPQLLRLLLPAAGPGLERGWLLPAAAPCLGLGLECQAAMVQERQEELPHVRGQWRPGEDTRWPGGDTPHPRQVAAGRRHPVSEASGGDSNSTVLQIRKSVTREFQKKPVQMTTVRKRKNKYFTLGVNQSNSLFKSGEKCVGGRHKPPSKNNEEII